MQQTTFNGQQEGERVLYELEPHKIAKNIAIAKIVFLSLFLYVILIVIGSVVPTLASLLQTSGLLLSVLLFIAGIWWNNTVFKKGRTYITDRRIIRFDVVSPFFITKRELFWNEALKAKAYAPNMFYRMMNVGSVEIDPILGERENVVVSNVYYFEDVANYIDKILFTFKNKHEDVGYIQPFVPKAKGNRG